jgi:predicted metal-dependent peptidase
MFDRIESLSKVSKELLLKEPYYGFFLLQLNKMWDNKRVPTAGVSKQGINYQLVINEDFWKSLSNEHRIGLIKHELLHIAFGHLTIYFKFSDKRLANVAMDMEINQYIDGEYFPGGDLSKEEFDEIKEAIKLEIAAARERDAPVEEITAIANKLPSRGIMIEDYEDLNLDIKAGCRYYYDKLRQLKDQKEKNGTCGNESMDKLLDDIENGDIDEHPTWGEFEDLTEAEEKLLDKQIQRVLKEAKVQTEKKRGRIPGEIESVIKVDEITVSKFDWRNYLRRFSGTSTKVYTKKIRRKENSKFPDNPGLKIKMKQHMLLAIDTSGSVSDSELQEFMNEMHHIYKCGVDITIVQCDTQMYPPEKYTGKFEMNVKGRGGTEFDPVLEYFNDNLKKYTSLVYFTDGECNTSVKPKGKILWILSEQSSMNNDLPGKVIKLEL